MRIRVGRLTRNRCRTVYVVSELLQRDDRNRATEFETANTKEGMRRLPIRDEPEGRQPMKL